MQNKISFDEKPCKDFKGMQPLVLPYGAFLFNLKFFQLVKVSKRIDYDFD